MGFRIFRFDHYCRVATSNGKILFGISIIFLLQLSASSRRRGVIQTGHKDLEVNGTSWSGSTMALL
jgi:hypothetical protein